MLVMKKRENWKRNLERNERNLYSSLDAQYVVQCLLFIAHQPQLSYKKVNDKFNPHKVSIL